MGQWKKCLFLFAIVLQILADVLFAILHSIGGTGRRGTPGLAWHSLGADESAESAKIIYKNLTKTAKNTATSFS